MTVFAFTLLMMFSFEVFTKTQNWQYWHKSQLCIPMQLQSPSHLHQKLVNVNVKLHVDFFLHKSVSNVETSLVYLNKVGNVGILAFWRVCEKLQCTTCQVEESASVCVIISELESDSDICSYEDCDGYKGIKYF